MKNIYLWVEALFERLSIIATEIFSNSITFILACCLVIYWLFGEGLNPQDLHDRIGDFILSITFLSFFIIQKTFNRFSQAIHLKLNELVASHESASNHLVNVEEKSGEELKELAKNYTELAAQTKEKNSTITSNPGEGNK